MFEIITDKIKQMVHGRYVVRDWNGDLIGRTNNLAEAVEMTSDSPDYWVEDSERGFVLEWRKLQI